MMEHSLSVADIRWQIAAEWSEIAQWSQWGAHRKPPLSNVTIDDSLRPPLPTKCGPKCIPREVMMSNFEWPYLRNGSYVS